MKKNTSHSVGNLATDQNQHAMSLTREQKKELSRLDNQYERINKISGSAGMNPDKFINEFGYKFMEASELQQQQADIRNEDRHKVFKKVEDAKTRRPNY